MFSAFRNFISCRWLHSASSYTRWM